eukprot:m.200306 g.200306  ORF g.200306 m.200306 type:complete len:282 (+) comp13708_c3_seq1:594-1439(+)
MDEVAVGGGGKSVSFEQLIEQELKKTSTNTSGTTTSKPKRPFLRRGDGLKKFKNASATTVRGAIAEKRNGNPRRTENTRVDEINGVKEEVNDTDNFDFSFDSRHKNKYNNRESEHNSTLFNDFNDEEDEHMNGIHSSLNNNDNNNINRRLLLDDNNYNYEDELLDEEDDDNGTVVGEELSAHSSDYNLNDYSDFNTRDAFDLSVNNNNHNNHFVDDNFNTNTNVSKTEEREKEEEEEEEVCIFLLSVLLMLLLLPLCCFPNSPRIRFHSSSPLCRPMSSCS